MAHHRFVAQFEIVVAETSGTSTQPADPMPDDLVQSLTTEINKAMPKKGGKPYKVEKVTKK
jgi:hypothetical protein